MLWGVTQPTGDKSPPATMSVDAVVEPTARQWSGCH